MSKLKLWVIESKYRVKLQVAYRKSSDTELLIAQQELTREMERRKKLK